ncbi:glycosyltransferase [Pseudonocardia broussonetiae]|uniref:Glycosyltransferase family 1 protein n=1 Tax=Pseudonocardia broussonetiae TaxID=2736640 RepID=A0A6M6JI28_9PSEU|nr:glycosyltransferase [Pseudonocardia broussonetiae]QJY47724.1 glycosyltransferase family 1 protein [Pseudonocardia broussonetiae]
MKILVVTLGTRGDVQPFVALARSARDRGHDVVLAAPERFRPLAAAHGLDLVRIDDGPLALMDGVAGAAVSGGVRAKLALARAMPAAFGRVLEDCATIARGIGHDADVVVHNGQVIGAPHVAELLGVPCVLALTVPVYVPTREFPWPGAPLPPWLPGWANRAGYLGMRGPAVVFARVVDDWRRRDLGLPRRRGRHDPLRRPDGVPVPVLNAVSRHVVPPPEDWPPSVTTTGYWFLPAARPGLPAGVEEFLAAGEPPVLVGFGSMAGADPAATTRTVLDAVRAAGLRAIVATGWGGLVAGEVPASVLVVDDVPHDVLLPRVAAVVHHGGAGTTAAVAAAGRPQVVCPFVADQPFWARRVHDLGVGPAPVPQRRMTAAALAAALRMATGDPAVAARAAALGARIREEDGTAVAVRALEALVTGATAAAPRTPSPPSWS